MAELKQQQASGADQTSLTLKLEDNAAAARLLGEYDSHLALIEDRLGVGTSARGNVITISGAADACATARGVLEDLYRRAHSGAAITAGEVDGAVRHAVLGDDGSAQKAGTIKTRKRQITARTPMQSTYIKALDDTDLVFATGPAGTGKTYLAVAYAAVCLEKQLCERLILSRPAVEAGERLGFLPGDMRDKVDPYLRPLYDALYDVLPEEKVERGIESGVIEIAPLAFMRGRTLANAFVILDEAQNCTSMQMKMFLTRLGENSKMVVTGDPTQIDLPLGQKSGLEEAIALLTGVKGLSVVRFAQGDVVRRELVARIVAAYERAASDGTT